MAGDNMIAPTRGVLTFNAEGQEGGPYHSRKPHVPGPTSGVTIGRGHDLSQWSVKANLQALLGILTRSEAGAFAGASSPKPGVKGPVGILARHLLDRANLWDFELTMAQQCSLFETDYRWMIADVRRICAKPDCVAAYGIVDWLGLDPKILDLLTDLRFRGDWGPWTRRLKGADGVQFQTTVARNDLGAFSAIVCDWYNWQGVPVDRFERRVDWLKRG